MRDEIRAEILELASEDFLGLWEVANDFRNRFPDVSDEKIRQIRSSLVAELLTDSLVRVSRRRLSGGPIEDLEITEAIRAVSQESSWIDRGPERPMLWLSATEKGEREGRRIAAEDSGQK